MNGGGKWGEKRKWRKRARTEEERKIQSENRRENFKLLINAAEFLMRNDGEEFEKFTVAEIKKVNPSPPRPRVEFFYDSKLATLRIRF